MTRLEAIKIILDSFKEDDLALFTTGMISREAFFALDRKDNFYLFGSMGLASAVALGIALHTDKKVFICEGDGSALMDLGTLAIIGSEKPANLIHIVLDNETYQSTGGQPTISHSTQLDRVAVDLGYADSVKVDTIEKLEAALDDIATKSGPIFIWVKVLEKTGKEPSRVNLSPVQIKERFVQALRKN